MYPYIKVCLKKYLNSEKCFLIYQKLFYQMQTGLILIIKFSNGTYRETATQSSQRITEIIDGLNVYGPMCLCMCVCVHLKLKIFHTELFHFNNSMHAVYVCVSSSAGCYRCSYCRLL